jgi:imidazoleglycerol phosphate synthase glutamine amidotransferase subunit HisH
MLPIWHYILQMFACFIGIFLGMELMFWRSNKKMDDNMKLLITKHMEFLKSEKREK